STGSTSLSCVFPTARPRNSASVSRNSRVSAAASRGDDSGTSSASVNAAAASAPVRSSSGSFRSSAATDPRRSIGHRRSGDLGKSRVANKTEAYRHHSAALRLLFYSRPWISADLGILGNPGSRIKQKPEGGRVVPVHVLVATGVNADGHREILGVQVT